MVKNKLISRRGESIGETLAAVLVMTLAFLILAGAVVSAARVNERIKNEDITFRTVDSYEDATVTLTLTDADADQSFTQDYTVHLHDSDGYYYYDEATKKTE